MKYRLAKLRTDVPNPTYDRRHKRDVQSVDVFRAGTKLQLFDWFSNVDGIKIPMVDMTVSGVQHGTVHDHALAELLLNNAEVYRPESLEDLWCATFGERLSTDGIAADVVKHLWENHPELRDTIRGSIKLVDEDATR